MASTAPAPSKATSPVGHRGTAATVAAGAQAPAASTGTGRHPPVRASPPREKRDPRQRRIQFIDFSRRRASPSSGGRRPYGGREGPAGHVAMLGFVVPAAPLGPPGRGSARSLTQLDPSAAPSPSARCSPRHIPARVPRRGGGGVLPAELPEDRLNRNAGCCPRPGLPPRPNTRRPSSHPRLRLATLPWRHG